MLCAQRFVITRPNPPSPLYPLYIQPMTSFVIYAVYVASNVCFLRAVAARSVVHVRAFILGAPPCVVRLCCAWCAPGVRGDPFVRPSPYAIHSLHMPFLYSYDLLYTLLALRATVRFHLRCYAGLRPRPQHAPPALYTHAPMQILL